MALNILDSRSLLTSLGALGVFLVPFAETGPLIGSAAGAVIGAQTGYVVGRRGGQARLKRIRRRTR